MRHYNPVDDDEQWALAIEPYHRHDPTYAPLDSEIDFDDEAYADQAPLDEVEAIELGVNFDDPELVEE